MRASFRTRGADRIFHFGLKEPQSLTLHISFGDEVNQYRLELSPSGHDSMYPLQGDCLFLEQKTT